MNTRVTDRFRRTTQESYEDREGGRERTRTRAVDGIRRTEADGPQGAAASFAAQLGYVRMEVRRITILTVPQYMASMHSLGGYHPSETPPNIRHGSVPHIVALSAVNLSSCT